MNFNFPFDPWPIQEGFMKELFDCLDQGKIGIFSSPTGTGKSLSMICSALTWQSNYKEEIDLQGLDNEPAWVKAFAMSKTKPEKRSAPEIVRNSKKIKDVLLKSRVNPVKSANVRVGSDTTQTVSQKSKSLESLDLKYMVDDYESDKETDSISRYLDNDQENEILQEEMQVFYCSRTHSQLSQFVKEVNKTVYKNIKAVVIGSRKSTCINQDVLKLKSLTRINDACLDLQKKKVKCKYYSEFAANKNSFVQMAHDSVKDIEELAELGREVNQCSYYGSREAIKSSQLIVLPYNLILQKSARESLGINLKNKVVIFDEAHNLIDAISAIYSVIVEKPVIERAKAQLGVYLQRYKSRLSGKNLIYIKQIQTLLDCLIQNLTDIEKRNDKVESILTVNDFVHDLGIDNLNLFKIEKYLKESRLAQKLNGFVVDVAQGPEKGASVVSSEHFIPKHVSSLQQIQAFLMSLTNSEVDGRILVKRNEKKELVYRYVLLNPAGSFKDIVDDAKSVVLAGGTMDPIQDFISQLYPHVPKDRLVHFSCGHVVPKSSLLTLCIGNSIDGSEFLFNNENKSKKKQIIDLGTMMEEYSRIIPGGIVVFFSSYAYLDFVYSTWKESGSISKIGSRKKVFIEPQGSSESDKILKSYEQHIISNRKTPYLGSILLAVVGGKVSEGINFSDDLGRAVFVIGLPFPNLGSIELQEKLKYLKDGSQEYYENLCMRAVNQSIGRAIRHIKDYSSIILIDSRWAGKIKKKLPEWILSGNIHHCDYQASTNKIVDFFKTKLGM